MTSQVPAGMHAPVCTQGAYTQNPKVNRNTTNTACFGHVDDRFFPLLTPIHVVLIYVLSYAYNEPKDRRVIWRLTD